MAGTAQARPPARTSARQQNTVGGSRTQQPGGAVAPVSAVGAAPEVCAANMHHSSVGPAHVLLGLGRQSGSLSQSDTESPPKRPRKERCPNWSAREIMLLVEAKRRMTIRERNARNQRELMIPEAGKWLAISEDIQCAGVSTSRRDGPSCKSKWNLLVADYKKIVDFGSRSESPDVTYWTVDADERKAQGLPRSFAYEVFHHLNSWNKDRPTIQPPHTRDTLSPHDKNFEFDASSPVEGQRRQRRCDSRDSFDDDGGDSDDAPVNTNERMSSPRSPAMNPTRCASTTNTVPSPALTSSAARRPVIPVGITPVNLSSSDAADSPLHPRPGSTAIRRRSVNGHSLIAEATRATGDALALQMKEMATESNVLERAKLDVQQRFHSEQMQYQMQRDNRVHEHAEKSIEKQGELVHCLSLLSTAITMGFQVRQKPRRQELDRGRLPNVAAVEVADAVHAEEKGN